VFVEGYLPPVAARLGFSMDLANFFKSLININKYRFFGLFGPEQMVRYGALLGRGCTKIEHQYHPEGRSRSVVLRSGLVAVVDVRDKRVAIAAKEKTKLRVCA
jgi:hypothetical protein